MLYCTYELPSTCIASQSYLRSLTKTQHLTFPQGARGTLPSLVRSSPTTIVFSFPLSLFPCIVQIDLHEANLRLSSSGAAGGALDQTPQAQEFTSLKKTIEEQRKTIEEYKVKLEEAKKKLAEAEAKLEEEQKKSKQVNFSLLRTPLAS